MYYFHSTERITKSELSLLTYAAWLWRYALCATSFHLLYLVSTIVVVGGDSDDYNDEYNDNNNDKLNKQINVTPKNS